jgi:hypothetical protein
MDASPPPSFPAASGARLGWADMPAEVRDALDDRLGARVVTAASQEGGFSPGVAARLALSDGRRVFAKAVGPAPNPDAPTFHRREARVTAALPAEAHAPRLLFMLDVAGWVVLVLEDIDGRHPMLPWQEPDLRRVLEMLGALGASLTPSPVEAPLLSDDEFSGFRELLDLSQAGEPLSDVDDWVRRNLAELAELEHQWSAAASGQTLLHTDIRADNLLLTQDRMYLVDWPHASIGPRWADLLFLLPSVAMQGGPLPWVIFDRHPLQAGADPKAVTALLAGLAGFFICDGRKPPPPGLPTLRPFMLAQGAESLRWLRHRTGLR